MEPIIQNVQGHGTAFLSAGGTVVRKTLGPGEKVVVCVIIKQSAGRPEEFSESYLGGSGSH